ncbi:MAG: ABC transporter substrate-binding protein [Ectothiorhodospiraceae bacterium]|nr:ABC transporter substrate-binding protein [Chromatiales bacterium]MCP5154127.1 ABC transporter substrate-binding protein [Ectothiorhodospiraceae bacterium]
MSKARLIAAAVGAALGIGAGLAQAKDQLVVNSFGGGYEKKHRELVIEPFEKLHDVEVVMVTAYSADTLAQLRAQKENPKFDVVHLSGGLEATAAAEGLLAPIQPSELTHHAEMYPYAVRNIEKGEGPAYSAAVIGILYDTEKVSPAPTSWKDLARPEFAGHLVLTDISNNWGLLSFLMINKVAGGSLEDIAPGLAAVKQMLGGATVVAKSPEIQQAFAQSGAWIAPYAQDYAFTLTKAGLPVKFVQPEEGAAFSPITVNLVAGTKKRDLAVKFIDFSLRAEASAGWAESFRYSPTNRNAKLSAEAAAGVIGSEEAARTLVSFDPIAIGKSRSAWTDEWNRAIAK